MLPHESCRQVDHTPPSSPAAGVYRKKKVFGKDHSTLHNKMYQCRFCSLKFCKSQALGGHMNRHRQERETETLNKARQLVFTNDLVNHLHLGQLRPTKFPTIPPPPAPVKHYFVGHTVLNSGYDQGSVINNHNNK